MTDAAAAGTYRGRFDLVIFDCDGVLVDSETLACRIYAEQLTRRGYPQTAEDILRRFLGVSDRESRAMVEADLGHPLPDAFDDDWRAALADAYSTELRPVAGARAAAASLALARCVASSGTPDKIRHGLSCAGLLDLFAPHLFSASDVARGKPAPDLFLHAAASMGAAPGRCLVIEDSRPGILAAKAAGMTVFGFTGGSHCPPGHGQMLQNAGADLVFGQMDALPALLGL